MQNSKPGPPTAISKTQNPDTKTPHTSSSGPSPAAGAHRLEDVIVPHIICVQHVVPCGVGWRGPQVTDGLLPARCSVRPEGGGA